MELWRKSDWGLGINILISTLLSKRANAATVRVLDAMFDGESYRCIKRIFYEVAMEKRDDEGY